MHTKSLPALMEQKELAVVPKQLVREFIMDVEIFYYNQAEQPKNSGKVFVVNLDGDTLLENMQENSAMEGFFSKWTKIAFFMMHLGTRELESFGLNIPMVREDYIDMLQMIEFEIPHIGEVVANIPYDSYRDALIGVASDFCKALGVLRLPYVEIVDPLCAEHGNLTFTGRLHLGTSETLYTPLYYMYPDIKVHASQREVW